MITFSTYDSSINSIYLAFYGRPADPSGLKFWSQALTNNKGDTAAIIEAFATSDEAQTRFGSDNVSARITDIYQQLFNRTPDAAGLAFWTDAVEQGKATLAEVSLAILKGAQSSDLDLSTLRQKAADAFTVAVENGSTEYSGYASIEAARVLVRAVTADATETDLANLVKAVVSFADTATKNPNVVDAIATGSTLLNLYNSARGLKDPVALTQALADTAKAAAGDPVTLESLLRGGGMDKVLKVMPAKATLTDVVEALAKGGLPAAVEVVYPTTPTAPVVIPKPTPATPMELKFDSVTQGKFDTNKNDTVTNVEVATVKFSYTGSDLATGQTFQYSTDGVTWRSDNMTVDKDTNTVTITGVDLTGHSNKDLVSPKLMTLVDDEAVANVFTKIQLQAVDATKSVISKADTVIEFDNTAPTKSLYYIDLSKDAKPALLFGQYGGIEGIVQWRLNSADSTWTDVTRFNDDGGFALTGIDLSKTGQRLEMRVIDAAGNVGYSSSQDIKGPAQPLEFKLIPTAKGLQVQSSEALDVRITINADTYAPVGLVSGDIANGGSTIGAQFMTARGGELKIARIGELDAVVVKDGPYVFGTNESDSGALHGQYVWGFGGNDRIFGTNNMNYLVGGAGADEIILPGGPIGAVDTLVFSKGDTAADIYAGGAIAVDRIKGAGFGDVIQLDKVFTAAPSIVSTFLTNGSPNQVAIVRGNLATDGNFEAGSADYQQDYLVQWSDGETVNSIMLQEYGVVPPALTVDIAAATMILVPPGMTPAPTPAPVDPQPTPIELTPSDYRLYSTDRTISLATTAGPVTAMNPNALSLTMHATGAPVNAFNQFSLVDGKLQFASGLFPNLYVMEWNGDTFKVGSGDQARFVEGGSTMFAGGTIGRFTHTGFKVDTMAGTQAGTVRDSASLKSEAFFSGAGETFVVTGGGHDVVMGTAGRTGGNLLLGYDKFDTDASDLVLRFRSGGDKVVFSDEAERIIDKNGDGNIKWSATEDIGVVAKDDEAVSVRVSSDVVVGDTANMVFTAGALRNAIDVNNVAKGDGVLILASAAGGSSSAAALFYYMAQDDNGQIDANELTTVAMFLTGFAPVEADIKLAGVNDIVEA